MSAIFQSAQDNWPEDEAYGIAAVKHYYATGRLPEIVK